MDKRKDEVLDQRFKEFLTEHDLLICKSCQRELDRGDAAWNNGSTEAGTDYSILMVICQQCGVEAIHHSSWYPGIDDFEDFVNVLVSEYDRY